MYRIFQQSIAILGAALFLVSAFMLLKGPGVSEQTFQEVGPVLVEREGKKVPEVDMKVRIVIDPGHGGVDGGTGQRGIILEKEMTLDLAKRLKKELEGAVFEIVLTRDSDKRLSLDERVFVGNRYRKAYFVSLHFNGDNRTSINGIETFYSNPKSPAAQRQIRRRLGLDSTGELVDERSETFAEFVQKRLIEATGARDRRAKNQDYVVIRDTLGPSILVEGGFLTNPRERSQIQESSHRQRMAEAIAKGIREYLEFTKNDPDHGVSIKHDFPTVPIVGPSLED